MLSHHCILKCLTWAWSTLVGLLVPMQGPIMSQHRGGVVVVSKFFGTQTLHLLKYQTLEERNQNKGYAVLPHLYYTSNYIHYGRSAQIVPRQGKSFLSCRFHRKVKWHSNRSQRKNRSYTKCEVTGDLHCISLPLKFRIERQNHKTVPESVTWYGRLARLRTSLDTRFTNIFLDYSTQKTHHYECHTEEQKTAVWQQLSFIGYRWLERKQQVSGL